MKGSSKVIMGATVVMVVTVAIVLGLVLVLLAELYCTFLMRRRHHQKRASSTATAQDPHQPNDVAPSLCSFYAQGVLRAPRSLLFPAPGNHLQDLEKEILPHLYVSSSSTYPWHLVQEASPPPATTSNPTMNEQLMYICNPIYDGGEAVNRIISKNMDTPFETPETSPSHIESESSSPRTPPLTPMKKLPTEGFSSSLRDARSICTTPSDSNTYIDANSSSSSASPSTSPSW